MVNIGEIYEDVDKRRKGRTFEIINIDNEVATCKNLTPPHGKKLDKNKLLSFIKISRFKNKKYYKPSKKKLSSPIIIRPKKLSLVEKCKKILNKDWFESGPNAILNSQDRFEISIRQTQRFPETYSYKINLDRFCINRNTIISSLEESLNRIIKECKLLINDLESIIK